MLDSRARDLLKIGDSLFSKKSSLDSLRQKIAELYYFERADFTNCYGLGEDYAAGAMTSYPHMARRELGGLLPVLLRSGEWFGIHLQDVRQDQDILTRRFLEQMTRVQMNAMRDNASAFKIAADEADDDLITFGDCVIDVDIDFSTTSLLYTTWHPRDCAWMEDARRKTDWMCRKWKPTARLLKRKFRDVHKDVLLKCKDNPSHEINCRHYLVRRDDYDYEDGRSPNAEFMSLYIDVDNEHLLEAVPMRYFKYVAPKWGTISGSQYGYSPAVVMPDARSANVVRAVLLDAGENAVNPPLLAVMDAIRSDINVFPGGITNFDSEYDEKTGEVLRPLSRDTSALPFGAELDVLFKDAIANSFYLNKLILPPDAVGSAKTAYEIQKRVQEHIRSSSALFEPIESGYSAGLCETSFDALMSVGTFGPIDPRTGSLVNAPPGLAGKSIEYQFMNPLRDTEKEMKAQNFIQGIQIASAVQAMDPKQMARVRMSPAFADALRGIGWPAEWLDTDEAVEQAGIAIEQRQKMMAGAGAITAGAGVAKDAASAAKDFAAAGVNLAG